MARGTHHQQVSGQALLFGQRRRGQRPAEAAIPTLAPLERIERALVVANRIAMQALIDYQSRQDWQDFSKALTIYLKILTGFRQTIASGCFNQRRNATLIKAIIDRDLLDLNPPRHRHEAFHQAMALLNNKSMPDANHSR
jgi:hypothetical protein